MVDRLVDRPVCDSVPMREGESGRIGRRAFLGSLAGVAVLGACSTNARVGDAPSGAATPANTPELAPTGDWVINESEAAPPSLIEGYAGRESIVPGEVLPLFVSTRADSWRARVFRIGAYEGKGGALVAEAGPFRGWAQGGPRSDSRTRLVDAPWKRSAELDTTGWPEGQYLIHLVAGGKAAYVPLVVRSTSAEGKVVVISSTTTMAAYNLWGGRNLYGNEAKTFDARSFAVSLDRPVASANIPFLMSYEVSLARAAEAAGVPLAWMTNVDVTLDPKMITGARGLVSPGHDEYWSVPYRDALVRLRDQGGNLAFAGANAGYWRVRLDDSDNGPGRRIVCYKSAALDPRGGAEDTTARWRDSPRPQPENEVVGMLYDAFPAKGNLRITDPDFFLFSGTGVREGQTLLNLVGDEIDRFYPLENTPRPIQLPAVSPVTCRGNRTWSTMSYYTTQSGAGVFAAGTMNWTRALPRPDGGTGDKSAKEFVAGVTRNLLREMAEGPMGRSHPARDDSQRVELPAHNTSGAA